MKIKISGASTLKRFTDNIKLGFIESGHMIVHEDEDFEIIQVHASPDSLEEDLRLLRKSSNILYLIHRPDEFLLHKAFIDFFQDYDAKFILLGDLLFKEKFWSERKHSTFVIPHPFIDHTLPSKKEGKWVIGSYTSWGEMRKLEHLIHLALEFKNDPDVIFYAGGTLYGRPLKQADLSDGPIHFIEEMFYPHFNVQLYHLHGHKRYGESSGSLHRGISIPIIFEANGTERLEGLRVIKIEADDGLKDIDFKKAAEDIRLKIRDTISEDTDFNLAQSFKNRPSDFALKCLNIL